MHAWLVGGPYDGAQGDLSRPAPYVWVRSDPASPGRFHLFIRTDPAKGGVLYRRVSPGCYVFGDLDESPVDAPVAEMAA